MATAFIFYSQKRFQPAKTSLLICDRVYVVSSAVSRDIHKHLSVNTVIKSSNFSPFHISRQLLENSKMHLLQASASFWIMRYRQCPPSHFFHFFLSGFGNFRSVQNSVGFWTQVGLGLVACVWASMKDLASPYGQ